MSNDNEAGKPDLQSPISEQLSKIHSLAFDASSTHLRWVATGRQIAAARILLGMTQAEVATAAGVSSASVQRAEAAGNNVPSMRTGSLFAIVRALETAGVIFIDADDYGPGVRLRQRQP